MNCHSVITLFTNLSSFFINIFLTLKASSHYSNKEAQILTKSRLTRSEKPHSWNK